MEYLILTLLVILVIGIFKNKPIQFEFTVNHKYDAPPVRQISDSPDSTENLNDPKKPDDDGTRSVTEAIQEINRIMMGSEPDE